MNDLMSTYSLSVDILFLYNSYLPISIFVQGFYIETVCSYSVSCQFLNYGLEWATLLLSQLLCLLTGTVASLFIIDTTKLPVSGFLSILIL